MLDLIHCDIWGPSPVKSNLGFLYYVIFIDDYSRFTWLYPLKFKSDFFDIFLQFQKFSKNQYSSRIKVFQSDGGTEFTSTCFKTHLRNSGIHHPCPYTPAQNGRAERKRRHVTETGLALLFYSHLSPHFWVDTFSTAAYIINRLPTPLLGGKSPFELLYGYTSHYDNFHPFGCHVYPYLHDYMANKLSPCSTPCIFLGYSPTHKGFRCLDPTTTKLYITQHAQFDETHFPAIPSSQAQPLSSIPISNFLEPHIYHIDSSPPTTSSSHIPRSSSFTCDICSDLVDESVQVDTSLAGSTLPPSTSNSTSNEPTVDFSSLGTHLMITRAKAGIFKTRHPANLGILGSSGLLSALLASTKPKGFKSVAKNPAWVAAMMKKNEMILGLWFLALPTPTSWALNGCFVLNICLMNPSSVSRLVLLPKVILRFLVLTTLTLSVRLSKLPLSVLCSLLQVTNKWPLRQLDVKNAFLNGTLIERVHVEQPLGYIDP